MSTIESRVEAFVSRLKAAPSFDSRHASVALGHILGYDDTLHPIQTFVSDYPGPMSNDEKERYKQDIYHRAGPNAKDRVAKLAVGTFALACNRLQDEFGFWSSVDDLLTISSVLVENLNGIQLPRLDELANDNAFFEAYKMEITAPGFAKSVQSYLRNGGSANYRTNLVFAYEYLRRKANPEVITNIRKDSEIADVVAAWLDHTPASTEADTIANVLKKIITPSGSVDTSILKDPKVFAEELFGIIQSVTAVFAPDNHLDLAALDTYELVIRSALPLNAVLPRASFGSLEEAFKPLGLDLWQAWDEQINIMKTICERQLLLKQTTNRTVDTYGGNIAYVMRHWKDTGLFKMTYNNSRATPGSENPISGCFRAGTMVWARDEQKPIESFVENDQVLTRADSGEYGICSDEKVMVPTSGNIVLFGINELEPFVTANHVFYTTTGLRAIDPIAAQHENPWLQVGALKMGHVLLRTSDGKSYERVPVGRITSASVPCESVHGLHLRSGLRSYHANGYLVHLNYPEITIASIGKLLRNMPTYQRSQLLQNIKELQPIFSKFGAGFVSDLLGKELKDPQLLDSMRPKPRDTPLPETLKFQTRDYTLSESRTGIADFPHRLPMLQLRDGVVFLDGSYCERAKVTDREIAWSRPIGDVWEHCYCRLNGEKQKFTGTALCWYDSEEIPQAVTGKLRRLRVTSTTVHLITEPEMKWEAQSLSTTESMTMQSNSKDVHLGSQAQGVSDDEPRSSSEKERTPQSNYDLLYDLVPYEEESQTPQLSKYLGLTWEIVGDSENVETQTFRIPALDDLAQKRTQILKEAGSEFSVRPYYHSEIFMDEKRNTMVMLQMDFPELLAMAADQHSSDDDTALQYENLTFKKSESDLSLPFIFSRATFTLDYKDDRIQSGILRKYNPEMRDNDGVRYRVFGGRVNRVKPEERLWVSLSVSADLKPGQTHAKVGSIFSPIQSNILDPGDLFTLTINDMEIKQEAQKIIHLAMSYHMDKDDRKTFLGQQDPPGLSDDPERPDLLPTELSTLDDHLKVWLKKTYANAFIAWNWSQRSEDDQKKAKAKFSQEDRDKLNYFWKGKGKSCLAHQPEFEELNRIATRLAIRRKVPRVTQYLNDFTKLDPDDELLQAHPEMKNMTGGEKWAQKLFYNCLTDDVADVLVNDMKVADASSINNKLNKICTLLATLAPQSKLSDDALDVRLSSAIKDRYRKRHTLNCSYIGDADKLAGNIRATVRFTIHSVLDGTANLSAEMKAEMQAHLNEIDAEANGTSVNQQTAAKTKRIVDNIAGHIVNGAKTSTTDAAWKILDYMKKEWSQPGQKFKWMATMGTIITVSASLTYLMSSWGEWKQFGTKELDWFDQSRMLTEAAQAFSGLALAAVHFKRLWNGASSINSIGREIQAIAGRNMEYVGHNAANNAAAMARARIGAPPQLGPGGLVARRHSLESQGLKALGGGQPGLAARRLSIQEKLVSFRPGELVHPEIPPMEKEVEELSEGIRKNYNKTGLAIQAFAIVLGLLMFVHSAIAVWRNRKNLDPFEYWVHVVQIIFQFISVMVDIWALFKFVPPQVTITLIIIGFIFMAILWIYQTWIKEPKPGPIQVWYEKTGAPLVNALPKAPPSMCEWSLQNGNVNVGKDSTITIVGKGRSDSTAVRERCKTIYCKFSVSPTSPKALFRFDDYFSESSDEQVNVNMNQVKISIPASLKEKAIYGVGHPETGLSEHTWMTPTVSGKEARKNRKTKEILPATYLSVGHGEEIVFTIRGLGAKKDLESKTPERYTITITETYETADGLPSEVVETELVITKQD
ncbi:hypothetical protein BBK36DRAFT_1159294 [Trichoderma citrinoviride]|uniref:Uncharacterized protein n=1 Tax=Trichoderma citrinoviride TaxID=58853 RepID=A0A2T4BA98_9HYPO|nr:hypothetical protein BBK36DRAFT_1159294 [Trichoderma citrinoviride]PTB66247.1 hypothetical protein BBK36DRAFT_1159294 [Trichoderma citrinoviride]